MAEKSKKRREQLEQSQEYKRLQKMFNINDAYLIIRTKELQLQKTVKKEEIKSLFKEARKRYHFFKDTAEIFRKVNYDKAEDYSQKAKKMEEVLDILKKKASERLF